MKKKILIIISSITLIFVALIYSYISLTYASVEKLPPLKNGDLVFQTIKSPQTLAVMMASKSPYTHIGIIKIVDKTPYVIEAIGPVREVSLEEWIKQGLLGRIAIMRLKGNNDEIINKSLTKAKEYYGLPYDFFFLFDKDKIYCSELVYYSFKEGANITLGKVEKVSDLNMDNSAVKKLIKSRWHSYYPCIEKGISSYEECLPVVMEQTLVTPASIANDEKLETIYSNY